MEPTSGHPVHGSKPISDQARIAQLESANAALTAKLVESKSAYARLHHTYTNTLEQLQLLQRKIYIATAERADTSADQLLLNGMFEAVKRLEKELEYAKAAADPASATPPPLGRDKPGAPRPKPKGRRNLAESSLPLIRVEITDPKYEGIAERIGFEDTWRLGFERGGMRRIQLALVVYKVDVTPVVPVPTETTEAPAEMTQAPKSAPKADHASHDRCAPRLDLTTQIVTTSVPKELSPRSLLAPSLIAHVLISKYMMGVPFYRLEQKFSLEGESLDRGTMSRYAEDVGATVAPIVAAMREEALATAFCLSTDATGVCIQPGPIDKRADKKPGPCRKGHFFVILADRDHVFFEYQEKHTSAAVSEMFKGFAGYIQADAHAIYDALFEGRLPRNVEETPDNAITGPPPIEVGCWSHLRRKMWTAAVCKHAIGVEGLRRCNEIFAADRLLADFAPANRKLARDQIVRPLVDSFFAWVKVLHEAPRPRGLVATALGYAMNQEQPLRRFLDDGRLKLENNASERALRSIATGRNSWLFFGSDDHAKSAATLFSLVASCKLHGLDPETYLADVIRVMPYWKRDRYLELAPKYWAETRARLDDVEMERPLGHVTVPAPIAAKEQGAAG